MDETRRYAYVDYIRAAATMAVVFLHVVTALNGSHTPDELGKFQYAVFGACHMLVKWAVPCFLMISGALLLNPNKKLDLAWIRRHVLKMIGVLLTFGAAYALMELVFTSRSFSMNMLCKALVNTAEGQSWAHLWYIYMLIGLYLITIPLKYAVEGLGERGLRYLLMALAAGNFLIPSINAVLGTRFARLMVLDEYVTYYLLGYYLSVRKSGNAAVLFGLALAATGTMALLEVGAIDRTGAEHPLNDGAGSVLGLAQSVSVFLLIKHFCESREWKTGALCRQFCACSFGIYLIHPFFIHLLYKVVGFTPLSMPIYVGIPVMLAVVTAISFGGAWMLRRIPGIRRLL